MNNFLRIRRALGLSQDAIAKKLYMTQGNVSFYELGRQRIPPDVAARLIEVARQHGHAITFDDIYGKPAATRKRSAAVAA